jgi:hypothetical protein
MLEKVLDFVEAYCMGVLNAFDAVVDWASDYVSPWVILIGFVLILSAIQLVMPLWVFKALFAFVVAPAIAGMGILLTTAWELSRKP